MKILITGARGYLGSLLCTELRSKYNIIGTSFHEDINAKIIPLDIRDASSVIELLAALSPDVIIHAAAIANVSLCEKSPAEAFKTNSEGTLNMVRAANEIGAKVILISSLAARNPLTVYGKSKKMAEKYVRTVKSGYEIVRLSMTFGLSPNTTNRRPFNKIISTMRTGMPRIYDNYWRFQPTYTEHLILVINRILKQSFAGRCLEVTTEKACTMYQIASAVLRPISVQGAKLYYGRAEQLIDPEKLLSFGFPTCSYSSMIEGLRAQLASFAKKQ